MEAYKTVRLERIDDKEEDAGDDAGQIGESRGHGWLQSGCRGRNRCCCCRDGAACLGAVETCGAPLAVVGKLASTIFAESHKGDSSLDEVGSSYNLLARLAARGLIAFASQGQ